MPKKQKHTKLEKVLFIGVLSVLLIGGVAIASANLSFMDRIADKAGEILGLSLSDKIDIPSEPADEELGHSVSPTKWKNENGLVTYTMGGDFADGTYLLSSEINPFGLASTSDGIIDNKLATSTVFFVNVEVLTGGTTTGRLICGVAADATSEPTYQMINIPLSTSTIGVYENNIATSTGGFLSASGGAVSKVMLTNDYSYFNCVATGTPQNYAEWGRSGTSNADVSKGITGDSNTFTGKVRYGVRKILH